MNKEKSGAKSNLMVVCHRNVNVQFVHILKYGVEKLLPTAFPLSLPLKAFIKETQQVIVGKDNPQIYDIEWLRVSELNGSPFSFQKDSEVNI